MIAEFASRAGARSPVAVVVELQADRLAALLLPGKTQEAVFADAGILANPNAGAKQPFIKALVRRDFYAALAGVFVRHFQRRGTGSFQQIGDKLGLVLENGARPAGSDRRQARFEIVEGARQVQVIEQAVLAGTRGEGDAGQGERAEVREQVARDNGPIIRQTAIELNGPLSRATC